MILAIESSCDESALAVFDPHYGLRGEWVHSQMELHRAYGGVVPDIASREHLSHLPRLLDVARHHHDLTAVSSLAVTAGPGLAACLALGIAMANALASELKVPLCGVNHLRGHLFSPFIALHAAAPAAFPAAFQALLPHMGLIVSGGNTLLVAILEDRSVAIIAQTVDDAAGECLDKGAKLLGLPYPGGARIEQLAAAGNPAAFTFPRALPGREPRFSFSGLKTSLRYTLEKWADDPWPAERMADLCASYQQAVIDSLVNKSQAFIRSRPWASIGLSGGVANNRLLRARFKALADSAHIPLLAAEPRHTGDNAAMIAFAAWCDPTGTATGETSCGFNPAWPIA
jgi:N6-L-threonylcarbamoyladenine synthase